MPDLWYNTEKFEKAVKLLLELYLAFAKIGLFTIGGGYAMIAVIEDLCVNQKKWMTHEEMMELLVIAFHSTEQAYSNFPSLTAQPIQAKSLLQEDFQTNPTMHCTLNVPFSN